MCLYPKLIRNPKYKSSKKRAREWRIRLAEELSHDNAYFITLTINDQEMEKIKKEIGVDNVS